MPVQTGGHALEVFRVFLRLGLTSFGGPMAHIGYFRQELVIRRAWLRDHTFSNLMALCHFLPGPASSQAVVAIGYHRAGYAGSIAAFVAFTLPSALIMGTTAWAARTFDAYYDFSILRGLELIALVVVAQAVVGMQATLCPDWPRRGIALLTLALVLASPWAPPPINTTFVHIGVILLGAALSTLFLRNKIEHHGAHNLRLRTPAHYTSLVAAVLFTLVLVCAFAGPLLWDEPHDLTRLIMNITQAGTLVFGGGHVVLPLLESATSGVLARDIFLAGYGAAQALPGPLFSFAAYIGMVVTDSPAFTLLCLLAIFAPGFFILFAALPHWFRLSRWPTARAAVAGVNAAVVGLLAATLINPLWVSSIRTPADAITAAIAFLVLTRTRVPVWGIVLGLTAVHALRTIWLST